MQLNVAMTTTAFEIAHFSAIREKTLWLRGFTEYVHIFHMPHTFGSQICYVFIVSNRGYLPLLSQLHPQNQQK